MKYKLAIKIYHFYMKYWIPGGYAFLLAVEYVFGSRYMEMRGIILYIFYKEAGEICGK